MANLGSVGVDGAFHHLFEYGTVSVFVAVGKIGPQVFVNDDGTVTTRPGLRACFTFDERVNDGHYCVAAIRLAKSLMEDPAQLAAPWSPR
jgi:pyruvate/2-oxoglutarate dehydrogenase complex dihydrolipoamide acyltransferase (E2) component